MGVFRYANLTQLIQHNNKYYYQQLNFLGTVKILTEHGASITIPNVRHATPVDCAHDIHILRILQRSLRRRSLVASDHGDYVNIEMMQKEDCPGIIMLISEPTVPPSPQRKDGQNSSENCSANGDSKSNSRASSRKGSITSCIPPILMPHPRSRKVSTRHSSPNDLANPSITEETEKYLKSVVQHLSNDPSSSDFLVTYPLEYDPTEQDHLITVQTENLDDVMTLQDVEAKKGLFTTNY